MKVEKIVLNEAREVSLTAYLLDTGGEFRNICNARQFNSSRRWI